MNDALRWIQRRIEHFYELESAPDVVEFVRTGSSDHRETLVLRQTADELELALVLPPIGDLPPLDELHGSADDRWLQIVEGVSHFVYVAERARTNLPATRLELELQAEVDKYAAGLLAGNGVGAIRARSRSMRWHLFERARFLDPAHTEAGQRYRKATEVAARYAAWLEHRFVVSGDFDALRTELRRFYRLGLREKLQAGDG